MGFIGGIHEDQIESLRVRCQTIEVLSDVPMDDAGPSVQPQIPDIAPDGGKGRPGLVHKDGGCRATADCLDSQGASAGEQIQYPPILYAASQDIEERLPDAVRRGAGGHAWGRYQPSASQRAADDSHALRSAINDRIWSDVAPMAAAVFFTSLS
jgi:hypothetical protein